MTADGCCTCFCSRPPLQTTFYVPMVSRRPCGNRLGLLDLVNPSRRNSLRKFRTWLVRVEFFRVSGRASVRLSTLLQECAVQRVLLAKRTSARRTIPAAQSPEEGQQEELQRLREEARHLEDQTKGAAT